MTEPHNRRDSDRQVQTIDLRLTSHEAVCAERYRQIFESVDGLRALVMRVSFTLISGMLGIIGVLFWKVLKL